MKFITTYGIIMLFSTLVYGQSLCDTIPFIGCQKNYLQISDNLKSKINTIIENGNLKILHIGDSHLQAAHLSERIKQNLYAYFQGEKGIASPGFIFPFAMVQTNNPFYYTVGYSGLWTRTRNVDEVFNSPVGLSGITVATNSPTAEIDLKMENERYSYPSKYWFDKITVLHNFENSSRITLFGKTGQQNKVGTSWFLEKDVDSIKFTISNTDTSKAFQLFGIILEQQNAPFQYHTIGVNGSMAKSYLRCTLFENHLEMLNPNVVIISLGTNEAYDKNFTKEDFIVNFSNLISKIQNSCPDAIIIVTTPNDHYKEGQINKNVELVRESIYHLKNYFDFAIWDFYEIMGGPGSISSWQKKQLAANDQLHFTRKGYEIQGDLFFYAFINILK